FFLAVIILSIVYIVQVVFLRNCFFNNMLNIIFWSGLSKMEIHQGKENMFYIKVHLIIFYSSFLEKVAKIQSIGNSEKRVYQNSSQKNALVVAALQPKTEKYFILKNLKSIRKTIKPRKNASKIHVAIKYA
ncbi:hypothetical protein ACJX0J_035970, partial [Zea mays]